MIGRCLCMVGLLLASGLASACEVETAAAVRDATHGNYLIPVRVKAGKRCVILDHLTEEGRTTHSEVWMPVEKLGSSTPKLGRFKREYQVEGEVANVDRFVYLAGDKVGEDSVRFSSLPNQQERRAVEYRISIE